MLPSKPSSIGPPTQPAQQAPDTMRLTPVDLIAELRQRHRSNSATDTAMLVVQLNRSDRLNAFAQQADARPVLIEVSRRVRDMLRPDDRFALVTPDEIWILLCSVNGVALAELAARTLRERLMRPIQVAQPNRSQKLVQMRPVVGGSWAKGGHIADPMTVVHSAAEAAVRARNNDEHVLLAHLDSDAAVVHRDTLERELRAALFGNELEVYFQPQIDVATGHCLSAEALVRWIRPDGKSVNPDLIASVCEERGMMAHLTQFVLNSALRNLMFWRGQGIDLGVGINLSAVTLTDASFPALVSQCLDTWGIPANRVTLELTESSIVQHELTAIEFMKQLKTLGCKLAIDDFGTGYSSFSYLRKFPLDELKIDQSFVRDMANDKGDRQIVSALIDLAHTFEMIANAEGIEDAEAMAVLRDLGCDLGQGYHFAKPLPPDQFIAWYKQHQASLTAASVA